MASWEAWLAGWLGGLTGWLGGLAGWLGGFTGWLGGLVGGGWTDRWTHRRMDRKSPILQDFFPLLGLLPKKEKEKENQFPRGIIWSAVPLLRFFWVINGL